LAPGQPDELEAEDVDVDVDELDAEDEAEDEDEDEDEDDEDEDVPPPPELLVEVLEPPVPEEEVVEPPVPDAEVVEPPVAVMQSPHAIWVRSTFAKSSQPAVRASAMGARVRSSFLFVISRHPWAATIGPERPMTGGAYFKARHAGSAVQGHLRASNGAPRERMRLRGLHAERLRLAPCFGDGSRPDSRALLDASEKHLSLGLRPGAGEPARKPR
jgi:hypothetical protein